MRLLAIVLSACSPDVDVTPQEVAPEPAAVVEAALDAVVEADWTVPELRDLPPDPGPDPGRFPLPAGRAPTAAEERVLARLREARADGFERDLEDMAADPAKWPRDQVESWMVRRHAGLFQVGPVGYAGTTGDSELAASSLPRDEALLLGLMNDRAPVVRAYAAHFLLAGGRHVAAVLVRTLADEGRMQCQHGCHITPCAVWETARSALYGEAPPLDALRAIAASGVEPPASRAAELVTERVQHEERGARALDEVLRDLREAP